LESSEDSSKWEKGKPHSISLAMGDNYLFVFDGNNYQLSKIGSGEAGTIPGELINCKRDLFTTIKDFKVSKGLKLFQMENDPTGEGGNAFITFSNSNKRKSSNIVLASNKIDARRPSRSGKPYCSICMDVEFPTTPENPDRLADLLGFCYFEIKIMNLPDSQIVGIGFIAPNKFDLEGARMIGWDAGSYGYHSDDGCLFGENKIEGTHWPKWSEGDVIGCGIDYARGFIFYTHNGNLLGDAFNLHSSGTPVSAFSFLFNLTFLLIYWFSLENSCSNSYHERRTYRSEIKFWTRTFCFSE
jgi:hypothetical protein